MPGRPSGDIVLRTRTIEGRHVPDLDEMVVKTYDITPCEEGLQGGQGDLLQLRVPGCSTHPGYIPGPGNHLEIQNRISSPRNVPDNNTS